MEAIDAAPKDEPGTTATDRGSVGSSPSDVPFERQYEQWTPATLAPGAASSATTWAAASRTRLIPSPVHSSSQPPPRIDATACEARGAKVLSRMAATAIHVVRLSVERPSMARIYREESFAARPATEYEPPMRWWGASPIVHVRRRFVVHLGGRIGQGELVT